jgi:hypothetical protein
MEDVRLGTGSKPEKGEGCMKTRTQKVIAEFHQLYPNATYTITFLDCKNGFKKTEKVFSGQFGDKKANEWGKANLPNFHPDMVHLKLNVDENPKK